MRLLREKENSQGQDNSNLSGVDDAAVLVVHTYNFSTLLTKVQGQVFKANLC